MYNRVWVCEEKCIEDFVVDAVGHAVTRVSFRRLVSFLDEASGSLSRTLRTELIIRRRYRYPGASCAQALRSSLCRCQGRLFEAENLFVLRWIWLSQIRSCEVHLGGTLSGEEVRGSGWPVRDVLDVLAGLLNRYYSLKGDAEDKLDGMHANVEALSERNASLREENGELRRSSVVYPLVRRRRGNDGVGRGPGS